MKKFDLIFEKINRLINEQHAEPTFEDNVRSLLSLLQDNDLLDKEKSIEDYIKEIARVLKPGGKSFIHHSWFQQGSEYSTQNIAGRSNMNPELFTEIVEKYGMKTIKQFNIQFPEVLDTVTIFEK